MTYKLAHLKPRTQLSLYSHYWPSIWKSLFTRFWPCLKYLFPKCFLYKQACSLSFCRLLNLPFYFSYSKTNGLGIPTFMIVNHWHDSLSLPKCCMSSSKQKDKIHHDLCFMNLALTLNRLNFESWLNHSLALWAWPSHQTSSFF